MKKEKIISLIILILILIATLSTIIIRPLGDLDELWNYNFARNVANGLVPYKDFNMVPMPLLPLLCGFILKITVDQLFIMKLIAAIVSGLILFLIYKIFKILTINSKLLIIFVALIGYLYHDILCIDYNWMSLLFVLCIVYIELKQYKTNKKMLTVNPKIDILIGLLAGLTFMLKQTSGFLICIAAVGNKLIDVKSKEDLKLFFKSFAYRLIGILIPILLIFIYLFCNNAIDDFISYTIKGASSFTNYISYARLLKVNITGLFSILVPLLIIYELYNIVIKNNKKHLYFLYIYGLAIFIIAFPISDKIHFVIGSTLFIILLLIETYDALKKIYLKHINNKESLRRKLITILKCIDIIIVLTILIYSFINYNTFFKDNHSELNHYEHVVISENLENAIKQMNKYILSRDKKVLILDAQAAAYMIPIDRYNKDYDMFNKGNFGYDGEKRLIQDISNSNNVEYLILKEEYNSNWQTPLNIINYVKNNKDKKGSLLIFDIYE